MKMWKRAIPIAATLLLAGPVAAQIGQETERAVDARRAEMEAREVEFTQQMREAEQRLEEAARRVAELSQRRLSRVAQIERRMLDFSGRPRLGVTIGESGEQQGPVEGVNILGVTPGGAASDAGLRAGDVITSINGESLSAGSDREATDRLLDFMSGVEEGDKLSVEYLRDGKVGSVEVEPRVSDARSFVWAPDGRNFSMPAIPDVQVAPGAVREFRFDYRFPGAGGSWADMELIELSEGLGRYFGTDEGLLVVNAPKSDALKLQDGDVIQSIDGREPTSIGHALRILSSYQPGEELELRIMRDKRRQTLKVEMPDDRVGRRLPEAPVPQGIATMRAHADFRL